MDKRKTIIVWMDGKKTKVSKNDTKNNPMQSTYTNTEQAAAQESNNEIDPIPTYIRQNSLEEEAAFKKGKGNKNKLIKHIFIATMTAVLLGVGLGIFMLNMFTNIDANEVNGKIGSTGETTGANKGVTATDQATYTLKGLQAFVLQAGLFNDEANVAVVQNKFNDAGIQTMVWKRDDQYYLFANIAQAKDQTDDEKAAYKASDLETYAKKWTTTETNVTITDAEYNWLQNFHNLWNASLEKVSADQSLPSTKWEDWIASYPENAKNTAEFYQAVKENQSSISEASKESAPIVLLNIWNQFDQLVLK
ncbi:hypothetical protein CFK37_13365 [Virgibacillus phasianinus]|uniref:SPOR domain-containing protein n=1 Tax=Virgibacillus phasianinus TaxID=2017483 RepID=A0A220U5S0_9BACI|nr:hypothetical protein [Virgibacillus phasianinus]ASK63063.1 hypothetical protein CFK37_13365 [Virgibacillus phasianinus]